MNPIYSALRNELRIMVAKPTKFFQDLFYAAHIFNFDINGGDSCKLSKIGLNWNQFNPSSSTNIKIDKLEVFEVQFPFQETNVDLVSFWVFKPDSR